MTTDAFLLQPVGWVHSAITVPADDCWAGSVASIALDERRFSADSLKGLDAFSHVEVVFLFHLIDPAGVITGSSHPRQRADWPDAGIFAQRARNRPNRLGVTTCPLVKLDGTQLWVSELDAIDGTPVLDIKPYMAGFGPRSAVREPAWAHELMGRYFADGR